MRVVVVSAWPPEPLTDGARLVLHHHLRHLAPRHDVTLLTPSPRTGPAAYLRRRVLGLAHREPADVYRVETPGLVAAFRDALRRARPDVVHLHGWGTAGLWRLAGGVPCVYTAIDCWSTGLREHQALPAWRRALEAPEPRLVRRHEARHYPRLAAVVVVTEREAEAVRAVAPGANVVVVTNGVELGPPPPPADDPVLGFHGNLASVANADAARVLVDDVVPLVSREVAGARARVIGPHPPAGLGAAAVGEVEDVRAALAGVAVYVAPLRRGSGIRNKVLEAMAAGRPVVATPNALEGIGAGPGVRVGTTAAELAAHAVALLRDRAARHREGAAARARVEGRTWAAAADALERVWIEARR